MFKLNQSKRILINKMNNNKFNKNKSKLKLNKQIKVKI